MKQESYLFHGLCHMCDIHLAKGPLGTLRKLLNSPLQPLHKLPLHEASRYHACAHRVLAKTSPRIKLQLDL